MRAAQTFQNWTRGRDETGVSPAATLSHSGQASSRKVVNSQNVEVMVFQTFLNYKQRSCIQLITKEQVKLISFIWEGVDFTLGIFDVPLRFQIK